MFRSDIAQFFRPSIDCIVTAILEQKKSAHKMISVGLYDSFFKYCFPNHFLYFSACCACGRVRRKRLVIFQGIWITYSYWNKHCSSRKPRVSFLQDQNDFLLKAFLETKLFRMVRSHSTSTTSWELAFPKSHMVPFALCHTIQMTRTTNHGLTMRSSIFLGTRWSEDFSISSYLKWVVWSFFLKSMSFFKKL